MPSPAHTLPTLCVAGLIVLVASSAQGEFPTAILTAAQALGAAKLAFVDSFPSPNHAEMMAKSRKLAAAAASVIQAYVTGIPGAKDDPETFFILLELFLIRDVRDTLVFHGLY